MSFGCVCLVAVERWNLVFFLGLVRLTRQSVRRSQFSKVMYREVRSRTLEGSGVQLLAGLPGVCRKGDLRAVWASHAIARQSICQSFAKFANCLPIACIIRCYSRSICMPVWFSRGHGRDIKAMACCFACDSTRHCMPMRCMHDDPPRPWHAVLHVVPRCIACPSAVRMIIPREQHAYIHVIARCIACPCVVRMIIPREHGLHMYA